MNTWPWLTALALGLSMAVFTGCEDDGTTTGGTSTGSATPAATEQVLADFNTILNSGQTLSFELGTAPAAGSVTVAANWTAEHPDGTPHPANLFLTFNVNGVLVNSGSDSPWDGSVGVAAGQMSTVTVGNPNPDSVVSLNVTAIWRAN